MDKYTFEVSKIDINYRTRFGPKSKSSFCTDITLENNKLKVIVDRKSELFNRKVNSITEGESEVDILDVVSIKYKVGFALTFFNILVIIFSLFFEMVNVALTYSQIKLDPMLGSIYIYEHLIAIALFLLVLINSTLKCVEIKAKNQDCIQNQEYKKIVFPIASVYFLKASSKRRKQLDELVDTMKNTNNKIVYKKDTLGQKNLLVVIAYIAIILMGAVLLENTIFAKSEENYLAKKEMINQSLEESNEKAELERQRREAEEVERLNNKYKIESEIKEKAVGMNIDELIKELEEKNIQNYSVKYISSKLDVVNNVIFVDKNKFCFYVIKDNNSEEMVEMPNLKTYMKKDEIIRLLEEKGVNYEFHGAMYIDKEEYVGTLSTYTYKPGTLIPKGIEVEIGLWQLIEEDEASELNDGSYYYEIDIK